MVKENQMKIILRFTIAFSLGVLLVLGFWESTKAADDMGWADSHPMNNGGIEDQMQDAQDYNNQVGDYAPDDDGE